jgi:hypothetical protein
MCEWVRVAGRGPGRRVLVDRRRAERRSEGVVRRMEIGRG